MKKQTHILDGLRLSSYIFSKLSFLGEPFILDQE